MVGEFKEYAVVRYTDSYYNQWNNFVENAKNATFLFHRDFMEYHKDRFEDFSLLIFKKDKIVGLLPANIQDNRIYSHQGLTYGGLLLQYGISAIKVFEIFKTLCFFLKQEGFLSFFIKQVPDFYCNGSNFEIPYILGNEKASLDRHMVLAIDYSYPINFHKTKIKNRRKSEACNFEIKENDALEIFWKNVLEPRLQKKYNSMPVHSLDEIAYLQSRFPSKIKQYNIYHNGQVLAGITIFETQYVVKSQYGATTTLGEKMRALDYLFLFLIEKYKNEGKKFFSMGTVTDSSETGYSEGMLKQKEELGCSIYLQDYFTIDLV
ncbi:FemAB family protein [Tamlana sp. s12]|uniref:FemAB family protein n=1 Tax=Tamlana sp. s12 TaxID=1630406 RepID=UPI0008025615|nr:FemAB family protein [Tamlana sp. s12]OBQ55559.1 FemAB family protein [Tamlana sp. s12]QQY83768.1 FemAB family protein [Tamlana sp. s12]